MKKATSYFIEKAANWLFRKRSPALTIFRAGITLITMTLAGGWATSFSYDDGARTLIFDFQSSSSTQTLLNIGFITGVLLMFCGALWEYQRYRNEKKLNSQKKTIVIEQRGLVDTLDYPLSEFIKDSCSWQIDSIVNDVRERVIGNVISRPEIALSKIDNIKLTVAEKLAHSSVSDISIAYGGVFPVPFSFYTGYLLDDESQITVYDWDRDIGDWRILGEADDGEQFIIEQPTESCKSVVLAVSVSYPVDRQSIATVFADLPIHYLSLPTLDRNNHWSKEKQDRLSGEFLEYCKKLLRLGVDHIHLIVAAQNSVAFRFGQSYDKRNLPSVSVYQYERHQTVRYPWCVQILHEKGKKTEVVQTECKQIA